MLGEQYPEPEPSIDSSEPSIDSLNRPPSDGELLRILLGSLRECDFCGTPFDFDVTFSGTLHGEDWEALRPLFVEHFTKQEQGPA